VDDDHPDVVFFYIPYDFSALLGAVGEDLRAALDKLEEVDQVKPPVPAFLGNVGALVGDGKAFLVSLLGGRDPDDGQCPVVVFPWDTQGAVTIRFHG
jgi:hypothetical protein